MSSDNHCKSFTPELLQSFTAYVVVVCRQTITTKVSHQNWCKVSQQKSWLYVVRQSPQKFHTRTGAKFHSKSHGRQTITAKVSHENWCKVSQQKSWSSDNHRKSFTPELVQNIAAKVMVVCRQTITAKVSHQNWCKISQQKSWSYVVRQSPQKFHTRTGAKFHSKSHGRQTITAKVSHQNWCKVSQQKSWSSDNHCKSFTPELVQSFTAKVVVVRESPQKFHTRTGAKFHSKSHGRQTITAKVSHQNWCKVSQQKSWLYKKITQTAVMNIVFQCIFIELDVSYASQHTFSKVTVTIFETYIYIVKQ